MSCKNIDELDGGKVQDLLGGFRFGARTFCVRCKNLNVIKSWNKSTEPETEGSVLTSIKGLAQSSKDGVCVIGENEVKYDFEFLLRSDSTANEEWDRIKSLELMSMKLSEDKINENLLLLQQKIFESFNANPPTAVLFQNESDKKYNSNHVLILECKLPDELIQKIENDLENDLLKEITIGIEWEFGLVRDQYASSHHSTDWGMFRLYEGASPEALRGNIVSISWEHNKADKEKSIIDKKNYFDDSFEEKNTDNEPVDQVKDNSNMFPKSVIIALWAIAICMVAIVLK